MSAHFNHPSTILRNPANSTRFIELVGRAGLWSSTCMATHALHGVFVSARTLVGSPLFCRKGSVEEFVVRPDITVQSLVEFHFDRRCSSCRWTRWTTKL